MPAMWVLIAAAVGACALVITWAIGLAPDVGGLIGLGFLTLGILGQMYGRAQRGER
jgi:hypothetical protein